MVRDRDPSRLVRVLELHVGAARFVDVEPGLQQARSTSFGFMLPNLAATAQMVTLSSSITGWVEPNVSSGTSSLSLRRPRT